MLEDQGERKSSSAISQIREPLQLRRFIKELSHEGNIPLDGVRGKRLEDIIKKSKQVLSELEVEHVDWINEKHQLLEDYLFLIDKQTVKDAYESGLIITIIQEFRTYRNISPDEITKLDDPEYLKNIITSYTIDFLRSLRFSKKLKVNPNIALDIAKLSYHHNPTKLQNFSYPQISCKVDLTSYIDKVIINNKL